MSLQIFNQMTSYKLFFGDYDRKRILWEQKLDNIELLAGMLAAGTGIIPNLDNENYYIDSDADISSFRKHVNIPESMIEDNMCGVLSPGEYGIWLKSDKPFHYNLYAFKTNSFFQGIISMCHAFGVDFRNYIYGYPFDGNGKQYALEDYVMTPSLIAQDAPDMNDDQFDDNPDDDENITQMLERSDDIITVFGREPESQFDAIPSSDIITE